MKDCAVKRQFSQLNDRSWNFLRASCFYAAIIYIVIIINLCRTVKYVHESAIGAMIYARILVSDACRKIAHP